MKEAMAGRAGGVRRRRHLSERAWGELFERFARAGQTVEEFCRREGVCRSSFTRWRSKLSTPSKALPAVVAPKPRPDKPAAFVELGVLGGVAAADVMPALDMHLDLGGGVSLRLVRR